MRNPEDFTIQQRRTRNSGRTCSGTEREPHSPSTQGGVVALALRNKVEPWLSLMGFHFPCKLHSKAKGLKQTASPPPPSACPAFFFSDL